MGILNIGFCINIDMCDLKCQPNMNRIGTSNQSLIVDKWTHLAFTNNANNHIIYINGEISFSTTGKLIPKFISPVFLGAYEGQHTMNGVVDDIKIYNRSLSQAEIIKLSQMIY
jgi:hypothetical protein